MIKCLDDGKVNLDSKYIRILREHFCQSVMFDCVSVSYSNSLAVSLIINEEIANSIQALYIPFWWKGQQLKCMVIA